MPKPSMSANKIPPIMAEPIIVNGPPSEKNKDHCYFKKGGKIIFHLIQLRTERSKVFSFLLLRAAKMAPVSAPLVIEFQGSSFPLRRTKPQSIVEKSPPHTAKLPANHQTQIKVYNLASNLYYEKLTCHLWYVLL